MTKVPFREVRAAIGRTHPLFDPVHLIAEARYYPRYAFRSHDGRISTFVVALRRRDAAGELSYRRLYAVYVWDAQRRKIVVYPIGGPYHTSRYRHTATRVARRLAEHPEPILRWAESAPPVRPVPERAWTTLVNAAG